MERFNYIPNRILDNNGVAGETEVHVYQSGTTTYIPLFIDPALTTSANNPYTVAAGAPVPPLYHAFDGKIKVQVGNETVDPYQQYVSRDDLKDPAQGTELIIYMPEAPGAAARPLNDKLGEELSLTDFGVTPSDPPEQVREALADALAVDGSLTIPAGKWEITERVVTPHDARIQLEGSVNSKAETSVAGAVLGLGQMAGAYLSEEWTPSISGGGKGYPGYFDTNGDFILSQVSKWTFTLSDVSPDGVELIPGDVIMASGGAHGRILSVDSVTGVVTVYRAIGFFANGQTITKKDGALIATPPTISASSRVGGMAYDAQFMADIPLKEKLLFVAERGYKTEVGDSLDPPTPPYGLGGAQLLSETMQPLIVKAKTPGTTNAVTFVGGPPPAWEASDAWVLTVTGVSGFYLGQTVTVNGSDPLAPTTAKIVQVNPAPLNNIIVVQATRDFQSGQLVESRTILTARRMREFLAGYLVKAENTAVYESTSATHMHLLEGAVIEGQGALTSTHASPFQKAGMHRTKLNIRAQTGEYGAGSNAAIESYIRVDYPRPRDKPWDIALNCSRSVFEFLHMYPADDADPVWRTGVFNEHSRWVTVRGQSCDFRGHEFLGAVFGAFASADCLLDVRFVDARFGSSTASLIQVGNGLGKALKNDTEFWYSKRKTKRVRFDIGHAKLTTPGAFVTFEADPVDVELEDCEVHIGFAEGRPTRAAVDCRHNHPFEAFVEPTRSVIRPRITGHYQHGDVFLDAAIQPHVDVILDSGRVAGIPDNCFVLENGVRKYAGAAYKPISPTANPVVKPSPTEGQVAEDTYETRYVLSGGGTVTINAPEEPKEDATLIINILNAHASATLTPAWNAVYLGTPGTTAIAAGKRSIFGFRRVSGAWLLMWERQNITLEGAVLFSHTFDNERYWNTTGLSANAEIRDGAFVRLVQAATAETIVAAVPGLRRGATYKVTVEISGAAGVQQVAVGLGSKTVITNFQTTSTKQIVAEGQISTGGNISYQSELRLTLEASTAPGFKVTKVEVREL